MARCPDCHKFVSYGEPEIELDDTAPDLSKKSPSVSVSATITLPCGDCGTGLRQTELSFELEAKPVDWCLCEAGTEKWEWESDIETEPTDRKEKGKRGKQFYGASLSGTLKCTVCNKAFEFSASEEVQASSFDEV